VRLVGVLLGGLAVGAPPLDPAVGDDLDPHPAPHGVGHAGQEQRLGIRDVLGRDGGARLHGRRGHDGQEEQQRGERHASLV
jgi:hypothetical protein